MISAGSALISSLWDRNVFPKVFRRSWLHAGLLSSDTVKIAGQKQAVAGFQLGDGDTLASGS